MIKAAFIGTGGIAGVHLRYAAARKDIKIAALCDINRANAESWQKKFGGEIFTDYEKMLEKVKPDAVWICTPSTIRKEPLIACAERKLPIFCEKPAERSVKKAEEISKALKKLSAKVQVGYVFRSMPVISRFKQAMKDDKIHILNSMYCCNISLTKNMPPWFYDKAKSGGALVDQATHNLDLLRYLFGEVKEVRAFAENPVYKKKKGYTIDEVIAITFKFANGMLASHIHSWVGDTWRNEIVLSGEKRLYKLLPAQGKLAVEQTAQVVKGQDKAAGKKDGSFQFDQGVRSIYEYENDVFIKQIKTGDWSKNPSSYEDAVKTLKLTAACDTAVQKGYIAL
jgi:predicted dehydrogenase